MKCIVLVAFFTISFYAKAQVKIGTNPGTINVNALLELESTSKGLLIPRLPASEIEKMGSAADGMMVYNTTLSSFYIRSGGAWKTIDNNNSQWNVAGNSGTNSFNFLGTTNNASFRLRTFNQKRMVIDSTGKVSIGDNLPEGLGAPDALLYLNDVRNVSGLHLVNSNASVVQFGIRSYVNGIATGSSRTAGEFIAVGSGNANTGTIVSATNATSNTGGDFTATGGTATNAAIKGLAGGSPGSTNYAIYGALTNASSGNDWAGYFRGRTYMSNRLVMGLNETPENAQLTIRTPDTSYNAIFATTANTGGNGILSTFVGQPNLYYALWGIAPSSGQNAAGYFSGNVTITGTLTNPSDERLKQDIEPVTGTLDKVMKLGTHTYTFRPEYRSMNLPSGKQFGYLAQDLEAIFPELVVNSVDKSKGEKDLLYYKSVNYIGMIPVLTKALQEEHQQRILKEEEISTLRLDNEALKKRLDAIEALLLKL